jgi:Family of unknown function (DUF6445)
MHETLSKNYIGYIDNDVSSDGSNRRVAGWIVATNGSTFTENDITVSNSARITTTFTPRSDVVAHYNNNNLLNCGFTSIFDNNPGDCIIYVKGEAVFRLAATDNRDVNLVIKPSGKKIPDLVVMDNFYADPDSVRAYALAQEFKANEKYHKGSRTEKRYIPNWVGAEFGRLLGTEVTDFVGATGVFQYCVAKDNVVYHYDTQQYAAMVYLSPNAPLQTGTRTLKSKITGLMAAATDEDATRLSKTKEELDSLSFNGNNFYDPHNFEVVDTVANVYNRLVIFNAQALHAATSYYGDTKENGRLFHLYFFNVKK